MAEQTYALAFNGYWRDQNSGGVPAESGVYCVYECKYDAQEKTVSLKTLIYIGEAADVRGRIAGHERREDWLKHVRAGNVLCFSFAPVESAHRNRCEAALIFQHKPPENTEYVNAFPFDKTHLNLSGKTALLASAFTVLRT